MSSNKFVRTPVDRQIPVIMSEMQTAADMLQEIGWGVSVFGSARIKPESPYYALAEAIGTRLAKAGLPVIAGGGPGIMEAANKGAFNAGGHSIGLNIKLPHETKNNIFQTHSLSFEYFYSRKATFFMHSAAYVALPGGFGTLDELFEVLTLIQTGKVPAAPVILMGVDYWGGLIEWIKATLSTQHLIGPNDLALMTLTDDVETAMRQIETFLADRADELGYAAIIPE
ncbi:TIGR00730 family Rossman fold protein [Pusillimonas sp. NJUB218]|nr:TIGR00730 family Rossman fold protein [Pusillimonas sp. NJUB218]